LYPDALPETAVAKNKIRNGHIDRKLSFPLEDLYGDGQPAGQVGQEIYGCGGAFVFAARAFVEPEDAPFALFTDFPCVVAPAPEGGLTIHLHGPTGFTGRLRLCRKRSTPMPRVMVRTGLRSVPAASRSEDHRDYSLPADAVVQVRWSPRA
jgi:hypothetical protein